MLLLLQEDKVETTSECLSRSFDAGIQLLCDEAGPVRILLSRDLDIDQEQPAPSLRIEGEYDGLGWFYPEFGHVDDCHELAQSIQPFFLRATGSGWVVPIHDMTSMVADHFDVADMSQQRGRDWKVKNCSEASELASSFSDGTYRFGTHISHLNTASWNVNIPKNNSGIRIRKLYDRFHGRQRARVFIDGVLAGWWYDPVENRTNRWAWTDFGVPADLTRGKSTIEIKIDPPPASPLWNVSKYEVLALLPVD